MDHITTKATIFLAIMAIVLHSDLGLVFGQQECQGDVRGLVAHCAGYVTRPGPLKDPSPRCCRAVSGVDIPCLCKYLTGDIERLIDMDKIAHIAQYCGRAMAPGTRCGSYTAPGRCQCREDVSESPSEPPIPGRGGSAAPRPGEEYEGEAPFPSEHEMLWAAHNIWKLN